MDYNARVSLFKNKNKLKFNYIHNNNKKIIIIKKGK